MSDLPVELILDNMSDLVFVMRLDDSNDFRYVKMNSSAMRAAGLTSMAYGATFYDVLDPYEAEFLDKQYHHALTTVKPISFLFSHGGQIGETKLDIVRAGGNPHVIGTVRDITERVSTEQRLRREAHFDALTGLMNRHGLEERLHTSLAEAEKTGSLVAVMVIDVDSLKTMNDTWGHLVGDAVLQEAARRIQGVIRKEDIVARIGGDEFILAVHIQTRSDSILLAERLRVALSAPWVHNNVTMEMSASMGMALFPMHAATFQEVLRLADEALYKAKQKPGTHYECKE
ncbi:sensor domain-containing diguanylate cyclase [Alicyclobacillus sp. SO9]|uniref:sensor domain-containing diguanylate cyclase n=1 Tax=Alicyclobacillus sp. SO9 TaxID=2665646 RepID=UPI0018E8B2B9|nr:sensor domain-containing diguanylate cyclase [Alicyclobacillus sp. SO9]QQE76957.1 diguanylate cyclase [Alicyclobacillus sp. SO9]